MAPEELLDLFTETARFWRALAGPLQLPGLLARAGRPLSITRKLLTYAPTGALVAAPTAGLPG